MKRYLLLLTLSLALTFTANHLQAQSAPPPPSKHGVTGNQEANGGGAPIGGGLFILLGLGAAYGGKKWYDHKKETLEVGS